MAWNLPTTGYAQNKAQPPQPPVQWDQFGQSQGFWQAGFDPTTIPRDKLAIRSALHTGAPQRLDDYRREAQPLISEQFRGGLLEQLSTLTGQQRMSEKTLLDQLQGFGVNPAAALGRLIPEQRQASAEQQGALRGQAIAGEAGAQQNLLQQLLSAWNEVEAYYDSLGLQNTLAAKARQTARHASKSAQLTSLIGGGLSAAGMLGFGKFGAGSGSGSIGGYNTGTYG